MPEYEVAEVLGDTPSRVWNSDNGEVNYYRVKLTNGTLAECGKKKGLPKVGDKYQVLRQASKPEFLPMLQKPVMGYQGGGSGGGKSDAERHASMAVAYAKDLVVAGKIELNQLSAYADKFFEFMESKAKGG